MLIETGSNEIAMRSSLKIILWSLVFCGFVCTAQAQTASTQPIYDPVSKSYFQLFNDNKHPGTWAAARVRAESKIYKRIRGRLAEVRNPEIHEFILNHFDIKSERVDVWIGLRYWCKLRMLQWGRSKPFSPSEPNQFRAWHAVWQRHPDLPGGVCGMTASSSAGYVPVHYRTLNGVTRWQASGIAKFFSYYLVEYPAGEEKPEQDQTSQDQAAQDQTAQDQTAEGQPDQQ